MLGEVSQFGLKRVEDQFWGQEESPEKESRLQGGELVGGTELGEAVGEEDFAWNEEPPMPLAIQVFNGKQDKSRKPYVMPFCHPAGEGLCETQKKVPPSQMDKDHDGVTQKEPPAPAEDEGRNPRCEKGEDTADAESIEQKPKDEQQTTARMKTFEDRPGSRVLTQQCLKMNHFRGNRSGEVVGHGHIGNGLKWAFTLIYFSKKIQLYPRRQFEIWEFRIKV